MEAWPFPRKVSRQFVTRKYTNKFRRKVEEKRKAMKISETYFE